VRLWKALRAPEETRRVVMNRLALIQRPLSLGGAETLRQHPTSMMHPTSRPEERAAHRITEGSFVAVVGLVEVEGIIADLEQGIDDSIAIAA
jgi:methionine-gamma-lyase